MCNLNTNEIKKDENQKKLNLGTKLDQRPGIITFRNFLTEESIKNEMDLR